MKQFIRRITDDGMHHLYLDDSSKQEFIKIAQASDSVFICATSHVIMSDRNEEKKRVFFIKNGEIYETFVPYSCHIEFFREWLLCREEENYFAIIPECNTGTTQKVLLGKMVEMSLTFRDMATYNMPEWVYFTKKQEDGIVISYFVGDKVISVGPYEECRSIGSGLLACKRADKFYDLFRPNSEVPIDGSNEKVFERVAKYEVFVWQKDTYAWRLYEHSYLLGKNAMCSIARITKEGEHPGVLHRLTEDGVQPIAIGDVYVGTNYVKVEDTTYYKNKQGMFDFEHPKVHKSICKRLFKR